MTSLDRPGNDPANGRVGALVLAAGFGERFGGIKQLVALDGRPLLDYVLATAAKAGFGRTVLVLGAHFDAILGQVELRGAEPLRCASWNEGMSASLRTGIQAMSDLDAIVVLLGDQPLIGTGAIKRVLASRRADKQAVRATYSGKPGHPVVLEASLFDPVMATRGDRGARSILDRQDTLEIPCEDIADPIDVDRPADLNAVKRTLAS